MFRVAAETTRRAGGGGCCCCCSCGVRRNGRSGFLNTPCRRWLMLMHVYMILYYYCTLYNDIVITINKISIGDGGVTDVMYIIKPPRIFPTSLDTGRRGAGAKMYRTFRSRPYARAGTHTYTHKHTGRDDIILFYCIQHGCTLTVMVCVCVCVCVCVGNDSYNNIQYYDRIMKVTIIWTKIFIKYMIYLCNILI